MNQELRIVFFGTPEFVVPVLEKLQENFEVVGVVSVGQGQAFFKKAWPFLLTPENLDQEFAKKLQELQPDLFVVASYGKIIPQIILDIPKFGALNIHPSLLPKYRGPSPIQSAILNGDKTSGISIIQMDAKIDHGPVVATKEISLSNTDTFDSLSKKMFSLGAELLVKIIPSFISGEIKPQEQNHNQATFTKMFSKEDGYFDPAVAGQASPAFLEKLDQMIRAFYPWPTAWTKWNNKIVKFLPEGMVQMEGKKPTKLADFLHGYPTFPFRKNL